MDIVERVARVLAGQHFSRNAHGEGPSGVPASELVDEHWRDYTDDALAVLRTLREATADMRAAGGDGSGQTWETMVRTAIGDH
jgi:hypothetical protein